MSILVTVLIPAESSVVERVERENPELMDRLGEIIRECGGIGHRRLVRPGEVLDLDEFDSEDNYRRFVEAAGEVIAEYDAAVGVTTVPTMWRTT